MITVNGKLNAKLPNKLVSTTHNVMFEGRSLMLKVIVLFLLLLPDA
jgi:hypothetical protein